MTKKLRRNFIIISMASVFVVLFLIIGFINIFNYISVSNMSDDILDTLIENGGKFDERNMLPPDEEDDEEDDDDFDDRIEREIKRHFSPETPFETRYMSILVQNNTYTIIAKEIISVTDEEAINMAKKIENKDKGYLSNYRFKVENDDNSKLIVFVDSNRFLTNANNFLIYSLIISSIGLVFVFVLVFFLSKKTIKPIIDAYDKQKSFITNASHELKTPLTIISANNEMIELTQGENELTSAINKQVVRMTEMVRNLTSLARLDETNLTNQKTFDIATVLNDLCENFKASFETKNIKFDYEINSNIEYKGDINLIKQLFSITLDNSLKYSKTFTRLSLKRQGNKIIYKISNDANTVTLGNLNECFERFYRKDDVRASGIEGSGIGLSIAKEIVNLHKGSIKATGYPSNIFEIEVIL